MARRIAAMMLTLSLATFLVAAAIAAVIRLPSVGEGPTVAATRPWECCDDTVCTRSIPPNCRCLDTVDDRCAPACKLCESSTSDPSRRVCSDWYFGDPGPKCSSHGGSVAAAGNYYSARDRA